MNWKTRTAAEKDIRSLQGRFNLNQLTAKVLAGRGITEADQVKFYLENDISFLHNPFEFEDMDIFCERILQAVENNEKVRVFGDRDVDGITSTSLMVNELKRLNLDVSYTVPMGDEPYGITLENIDKAVQEGITLAITVDCGISCFNEISYANEKGLDFLVTDHHIPSEYLPPACAIIDPKIEGCGYPFRDLAGCGVALKCIWALRFAKTDLYRNPVILLHAFPGNDTVVIEAVKTENLIVSDRISEEVVPGILPEENSRLLRFLNCNLPILVLDKDVELKQLKRAFPKADINIIDLRSEFEKYLVSVKGKSLFDLSLISKFALYAPLRSELDTLVGLYNAYIRMSHPLLYKEYVNLTDLAAIGTISDLMPMTDENRIIVRNGLRQLEVNTRESLLPFMSMQNLLGHRLSTTDISWQMSPLLNASGRLGSPDIAINMILSSDQHTAYQYSTQLASLNKERQKLGEENWLRLQDQANKFFENSGSKFVLVNDSRIPRGITGILATRLQKVFKVPSVVITTASDGRNVGSMRSPSYFNCYDFLSKYCSLFSDFGGHDCAGGFTLKPDCKDELIARISEDIDFIDCPVDDDDTIDIDAVLSSSEFNQNLMSLVEKFEPYGEQNGPVTFRIDSARLENITAMANQKDAANNHLKIVLNYGSYRWPSVFWSAGSRVGRDFGEGEIADVVFRMGRNYYKNQETIQLTILDIKRH